MEIPFCKISLGEEEKKAVSDVIDSGWVVMGEKTQEFEEMFADYVGGKYAVFVDSGTAALDLAVKTMKHNGVWGDSPVPVASLTFTSTAEVLVNNSIKPKFIDLPNKSSYLIDMANFPGIHVHLLGERNNTFAPIYDSAHRIEKDDCKFSSSIWCYSFYATKNMTTVQGGMIVTNQKETAVWLKMARDHGLNLGTKERYKEKYKQYDVKFVGWRYKGDDLRAAIGIEQLKKLPKMNEERRRIVDRYNNNLGLNNKGNHVYPVLVENREKLMNLLHDSGIQTTVHFSPLHLMSGYKSIVSEVSLPNTEFVGKHILSLPLYPSMKDEEVDYVSDHVLSNAEFIKHE